MDYRHTQRSPLAWMMLVVGLGLAVIAWMVRADQVAGVVLAVIGATCVFLAACLGHLRVEDSGEHVAVRYGPLPVFRTRVEYATITAVEAGRTSLIDGWGIHFVPGRGWTYNLWGRDCVIIRRGDRTLRIGTDDPAGLAEFLRWRTGLAEQSRQNIE